MGCPDPRLLLQGGEWYAALKLPEAGVGGSKQAPEGAFFIPSINLIYESN